MSPVDNQRTRVRHENRVKDLLNGLQVAIITKAIPLDTLAVLKGHLEIAAWFITSTTPEDEAKS